MHELNRSTHNLYCTEPIAFRGLIPFAFMAFVYKQVMKPDFLEISLESLCGLASNCSHDVDDDKRFADLLSSLPTFYLYSENYHQKGYSL